MNLDEMKDRLVKLESEKAHFEAQSFSFKERALLLTGHINELRFIMDSFDKFEIKAEIKE